MPEGIHIVSFDVPFPPDYGGVIDVYFKAKALSKEGLKVILHCFQYGRPSSKKFESDFFKVIYYKRKVAPSALLARSPFIVKTRKNEELLTNLQSNEWPILFEGLHTCAWLDAPRLKDRIKLVRTHNVEHDYYAKLAASEDNVFRKRYFKTEAKKLARFEKILNHANHILTLSQHDQKYFEKGFDSVQLFYPFHFETELPQRKKSKYAFYHGKLEVTENKQAVQFLIDQVFDDLDLNLVVAGKGSWEDIVDLQASNSKVEFYLNPSEEEMANLASRSAVHVLPTFQDTGFKLKLLYSLQSDAPIVVNPEMVKGTGLSELVILAKDPEEFKKKITMATRQPLSDSDLDKRRKTLLLDYSNQSQAQNIMQLLS
ncbi:MAG: glycosyltransferase [Flavobacteriales bacterium]|nr:glycosyltransferase [Flavobacteriales bacterium]